MAWIIISLFGAVGTGLRYGLSLLGNSPDANAIPWGTWLANVLGSAALGVVFVLGEGRTIAGVDARLALGAGLLGGFTTYSAFNLESLRFLETGAWGKFALYFASTLLVCLVCAYAALRIARSFR